MRTIAATEKKELIISVLKTSLSLLFRWFNKNFMKASGDKSHLIMSCKEATSEMIGGLPKEPNKKRSYSRNNHR